MIIYFSGNGNSEHVARQLAKNLGERDVLRLDKTIFQSQRIEVPDGDTRLVWVFPVYAWGIPPVVEKFMKVVEITFPGIEQYMVATCGDDTGNIDRQWRRILHRRGMIPRGCWSVTMPNTYVTMKGFDVDPKELEQKKLSQAEPRIVHIAKQIAAGEEKTDILRGRFAWLKSGVIRPWFRRFAMSPKPFHVSDACTGCGTCARCCPMHNITLDSTSRKPSWGGDCAFCLGCYNRCPAGAIGYGKKTKGKHQYYYKN